ncbi:MAG: glycosyltransferase family 4 protein [Anaerolineales bacterium]|jgi:glycosyltransferase involved in cell wall biosynthesis
MRILFLLTQDLESPGGLGRYFPLARWLAKGGHQVSIAALHGDYQNLARTRFEQDGVQVWYVGQMHVLKRGSGKQYYPAGRLLAVSARATWNLSRAALQSPADIVHIGKPHPMNGTAGLLAKYLRGRTVFLDCDDYEAGTTHFTGSWQKWGVSLFENNLPKWVDHVTTHTHFVQNRMTAAGIPAECISYIPNGVDPVRFQGVDRQAAARLRDELGLAGKQVVAYIGSLSLDNHPVDLLLRAFQILRTRLPEAVLLVVGGGADYQTLKSMASELSLGEAAQFCGRVAPEQVPLYYHLAEVSVEPVYDDAAGRSRLPLKLFESWILGTPFVSADVGERGMMLGDPPAGILAQPGDPASLAEALYAVLTDQQLAETLRQRGLARVQEYTWDRLAKQMEAVYHSVIVKRAGK